MVHCSMVCPAGGAEMSKRYFILNLEPGIAVNHCYSEQLSEQNHTERLRTFGSTVLSTCFQIYPL